MARDSSNRAKIPEILFWIEKEGDETDSGGPRLTLPAILLLLLLLLLLLVLPLLLPWSD